VNDIIFPYDNLLNIILQPACELSDHTAPRLCSSSTPAIPSVCTDQPTLGNLPAIA
jgi:hypothetical protein